MNRDAVIGLTAGHSHLFGGARLLAQGAARPLRPAPNRGEHLIGKVPDRDRRTRHARRIPAYRMHSAASVAAIQVTIPLLAVRVG